MYLLIKTLISALIIVLVSEVAKRYTWTAAIIVSNSQSDLIQRRELPEDLLRNDILPDRFVTKGS